MTDRYETKRARKIAFRRDNPKYLDKKKRVRLPKYWRKKIIEISRETKRQTERQTYRYREWRRQRIRNKIIIKRRENKKDTETERMNKFAAAITRASKSKYKKLYFSRICRKFQIPTRLDWNIKNRIFKKYKRTRMKNRERLTRLTDRQVFRHVVLTELVSVVKQKNIHVEMIHQNAVDLVSQNNQLSGDNQYILDSGAMRNSGSAKSHPGAEASLEPLSKKLLVRGVHNQTSVITHGFTMSVPSSTPGLDLEFEETINIPNSSYNLISVGLLDDAGCTTVFKDGVGKVYNAHNELILYAKKTNGLYPLQPFTGVVDQNPQYMKNYSSNSLLRAHETLNHRNFDEVRKLLNMPPESRDDVNPVCRACCYAGMRSSKVATEGLLRAPRFGYRLHSDTSRKKANAKFDGKSGLQRFVLTADEYSGYLFVTFQQRKSDVQRELLTLIDTINNERSPEAVAEHQTDGGKEFLNAYLENRLKERGIRPRNSNPYCQYENGFIEARMRTIQHQAKAIMIRGNASPQDWPYAINHAVYMNNILPSAITGLTPYEKKTGVKPEEKPHKIEGILFQECYAKRYIDGKEERNAVQCVYMGKNPNTTGSLVRTVGGKRSNAVISAKIVQFVPGSFPYANQEVPLPDRRANVDYDSDTDQEEDGIILTDIDGVEVDDGYSCSDDDSRSESEPDSENFKEFGESLRDKLSPTYDDSDSDTDAPEPKGTINGEAAWEIEDIIGEKYEKGKGRRKVKYYKVKWKGYDEPDWLHCSRVRAPELVANWKRKKDFEQDKLNDMVMSVCQLNLEVDVQPRKVKEETNPFKKLFDPKYQTRIPPPKGYQSMLKHEYSDYFQQALIKEKMENKLWNTYVEIPRSEVPAGTQILRPVTAYDIKYNERGEIYKFKSRVCLNGSVTSVDPDETYEAIASVGTIRLLLCMAARYGLKIAHTDVRNFFLQAVLPNGVEYYAEIPDGWAENDPKTHVAKVLAPWYGLKESAKIAGDQLSALMTSKDVGLQENPWMPKVFFKWDGDDFVCCATHIDDGVWIYSSRELLDKTLDAIDKSFKMTRKYDQDVKTVLGMEIEHDQDRGYIKLHQTPYILAKLKEMKSNVARPAKSPGVDPPKVDNPVNPPPPVQASDEDVRKYQKKIGVYMWSLQTDPSSTFVVNRLAKAMLNPQKHHWAELKRLEQYKATNPGLGIVFRRAIDNEKLKKGTNLDCLTYYADADLEGDRKDSKSTSGYSVHLGDSGMFDWKSKKQTCVCQSSCESEVYSSKECTCHAIWLRNSLSFMGFTFTRPTPVCQDNQGAIAICKSEKHHSRTRHFRMHVNILRDSLQKRITRYPWVPTKYMKGDLFNKAHGPKLHENLCNINGIYAEPVRLVPDTKDIPMVDIDGWAVTLKQQYKKVKHNKKKKKKG